MTENTELRLFSVDVELLPDNTFALDLPNYWVFESIGLCAPVRKITGFILVAANSQTLVRLSRIAMIAMCKRGKEFSEVPLVASSGRGPWTTSVYGNLRAEWGMIDATTTRASVVLRGFLLQPKDLNQQ